MRTLQGKAQLGKDLMLTGRAGFLGNQPIYPNRYDPKLHLSSWTSRKCVQTSPYNPPRVGVDFPGLYEYMSWKSKTKDEVCGHIDLDKQVWGLFMYNLPVFKKT